MKPDRGADESCAPIGHQARLLLREKVPFPTATCEMRAVLNSDAFANLSDFCEKMHMGHRSRPAKPCNMIGIQISIEDQVERSQRKHGWSCETGYQDKKKHTVNVISIWQLSGSGERDVGLRKHYDGDYVNELQADLC